MDCRREGFTGILRDFLSSTPQSDICKTMSKSEQIIPRAGAMLSQVCEYECASESTAKLFDAIILSLHGQVVLK